MAIFNPCMKFENAVFRQSSSSHEAFKICHFLCSFGEIESLFSLVHFETVQLSLQNGSKLLYISQKYHSKKMNDNSIKCNDTSGPKGQFVSERNFGAFKSPKKDPNFLWIFALVCKMGKIEKINTLHLSNIYH